ncbi:MAG: deoxyguanosinetriphosphate triphosphohydrolase [Candidatus Nanopelagicales bacterium]|nr:deoxyguanosinetriphosphate triphosphohydrolase [Candidatus Nanopelagicales bacterium]
MLGTYTEFDSQRWVNEPNKSVERTEFARDRARVMHSSALRRLGVKTQVMEAGQEDFPRTRLTHSLEVAQVGRELGSALGCDPDLVDTACLSHDLGHPPFGHNGETALNELATEIGGFEGNAQSFRLLTRLEPKAVSPDNGPRPGQTIGLNLTRASLDAASKYPWTKQSGQVKFGVYEDDADVFAWVREGVAGKASCFEAQVMDWSDDVSYCVHDVEDAVFAGHVNIDILKSSTGRSEVVEVAQKWYGSDFARAELDAALIRVSSLPSWPASFDGTMRALAELKNLTSTLIGRFCIAAQQATQAEHGQRPLTRYQASLVVPDEARYEVTALKALAATFVMNRAGADEMYARQRQQIKDLVEFLSQDPESSLDRFHANLWVEATSPAAKFRVVIDQVAALTDVSLVQWHQRSCT